MTKQTSTKMECKTCNGQGWVPDFEIVQGCCGGSDCSNKEKFCGIAKEIICKIASKHGYGCEKGSCSKTEIHSFIQDIVGKIHAKQDLSGDKKDSDEKETLKHI